MYEQIIVAIDGSLSSLNALRQSFRIRKAEVTGVCIAPRYEGDPELLVLELLRTDLQTLLRAPCDKAASDAEEIARQENATIETTWEFGSPHDGILEVAEARGCDLIVMGRSGYGGLQPPFIGSVTARVIGYSPVDVLVVPESAALGWKRILLAADGSEYSKKATLRAMTLAKEYGSELKVVSATDIASEFHAESSELAEELCEWPKYCVTNVREQAVKMGVYAECMVRQGKAYRAILSVAEEQKADIIVVGSHGRTGLKRLLMGSVTERVIGHSSCPVLVVKG